MLSKKNDFTNTLAGMGVVTMTATADPDEFRLGFTPVFVTLIAVLIGLGVVIYLYASSAGFSQGAIQSVESIKKVDDLVEKTKKLEVEVNTTQADTVKVKQDVEKISESHDREPKPE